MNEPQKINTSLSQSYAEMQAKAGLSIRPNQLTLSQAIKEALDAKIPLLAEAPTGTGKTLAYLLGALAASREKNTPIVVATATKALQSQILANDLPQLYLAGLLSPNDVALAKGKGNYLCVASASELTGRAETLESDTDEYLNDALLASDPAEVAQALSFYKKGAWDGDFDSYRQPLSTATRRAIGVSSDTCRGTKCDEYKTCAYFGAKNRMRGKTVLIANQDLVLMDLHLCSEGIEPTLGVGNYFLIVDEAHHLPQKAIQIGAEAAALTQLLNALPKLQGVHRLVKDTPELQALLALSNLSEASFDRGPLLSEVRGLIFLLLALPVQEESGIMRFPGGALPSEMHSAINKLVPVLSEVSQRLSNTLTAVETEANLAPAIVEKIKELQHRVRDLQRIVKSNLACLKEFLLIGNTAKWLYRKEDSITLHVAPLEGAPVLKKLLWTSERVKSAVLLSATLKDLEGFSRYSNKSGAPANSKTLALPHSFPYEESELVVAGMVSSPKFTERKLFVPELKSKLPGAIDPAAGTLVLLPSWALLQEMAPLLQRRFGAEKVRVQGSIPSGALVAAHKAAIDAGEGSILVGVATLSEGLDLPGAYCTHVLICALPFSVPTDPVEQELAERLGSRYFEDRSLPDAVQRLKQMVGRLNRSESDRGRITLFDHRAATTGYGRKMLKSLPAFTLRVEEVSTV